MAATKYQKLLFVALAVLLSVSLAYGMWLPKIMYQNYQPQLIPFVKDVHTGLHKTAASVQDPLFNVPGLPAAVRQQDISTILQQNAAVRVRLRRLAGTANELRVPPPGIGLAVPYKNAAAARSETLAAISRSSAVLDSYDNLLGFLGFYSAQQVQLAADLQFAGSLARTGRLEGRSAELDAAAERIRGYARQLQAVAVPDDFAALKTEVAGTFAQTAEVFDRLAYMSYLAVSGQNEPLAQKIAALIAKNGHSDLELLVALSETSSTLQGVSELPEHTAGLAGR